MPSHYAGREKGTLLCSIFPVDPEFFGFRAASSHVVPRTDRVLPCLCENWVNCEIVPSKKRNEEKKSFSCETETNVHDGGEREKPQTSQPQLFAVGTVTQLFAIDFLLRSAILLE